MVVFAGKVPNEMSKTKQKSRDKDLYAIEDQIFMRMKYRGIVKELETM